MKFLPLAGTHGWSGKLSGQWWQEGSPFLAFCDTFGWEPYDRSEPFVWDTGVGGLPWAGTSGWYAAGLNLKHYDGFGSAPIRIVAHSHGGQVVAYAAAKGLKIHSLITISTPVRVDMYPIWERARPNIAHWTHVYSDWTDFWQPLGGLFDGFRGVQRRFEWEGTLGGTVGADRHLALPGIGHTGLLKDPLHFPLWVEKGLFDDLAL